MSRDPEKRKRSNQAYKDRDPEHYKKLQRAGYDRNRKKRRAKDKALRAERQAFVRELKGSDGCMDCKERDWVVLEYHHIDPLTKSYTIAKAVGGGYTKENILKEIQKCVLLCANCHKRRHAVNMP